MEIDLLLALVKVNLLNYNEKKCTWRNTKEKGDTYDSIL